jgi:hypothetical protein
MPEYFNQNEANLFIQVNGPNTAPVPLGCHDMGDIAAPQGDITTRYCPDPSAPGKWTPVQSIKSMAGRITFNMTAALGSVRDYLEHINCPAPVYVNFSKCGRKDLFSNYDRGMVLEWGDITNKGMSSPASREGTEPVSNTFDFSAEKWEHYFNLALSAQTTPSVFGLNDICFATDFRCPRSGCGAPQDTCTVGFKVAKRTGAVAAFVYYTLNGGATWTVCTAQPFAVSVDIGACVCFPMSRDVTRVLVSQCTTDATHPKVAYSDDLGVTWTVVDVGTVDTMFIPFHALHAISSRYIWAGISNGSIYFSDDGGVTWTAQGSTMAVDITDIHFADVNFGAFCGETNHLYVTINGGDTWTEVNGPVAKAAITINACWIFDRYRYWIAYADGTLYYTVDGGTTWAARGFGWTTATTAFNPTAMSWYDEYCGYMTGLSTKTAALWGTVYRTIDGGFTWEYWESATALAAAATGFNSVWACGFNEAHVVGDPLAAVAFGTVYVLSD